MWLPSSFEVFSRPRSKRSIWNLSHQSHCRSWRGTTHLSLRSKNPRILDYKKYGNWGQNQTIQNRKLSVSLVDWKEEKKTLEEMKKCSDKESHLYNESIRVSWVTYVFPIRYVVTMMIGRESNDPLETDQDSSPVRWRSNGTDLYVGPDI